jgi:hypothetical protein
MNIMLNGAPIFVYFETRVRHKDDDTLFRKLDTGPLTQLRYCRVDDVSLFFKRVLNVH